MKKKLTEAQLIKRDAGRNIGEELLQAVREIKAGKTGRVFNVEVTEAAEARTKLGLSQADFAGMLGVSVRTLQDWEQGRREPSGAAKALLKVATHAPKAVRAALRAADRKSVVEGKKGAVRVERGGRRIIKKQTYKKQKTT